MKSVVKTQPKEINGRQVKSIEKWASVYYVQFESGRPTFISFKEFNLQEPEQKEKLDLSTIKVFLENQLSLYSIDFVKEEDGIKIGATCKYNYNVDFVEGDFVEDEFGLRIPATSYRQLPKHIIYRLKENDIQNVSNVLKENKFDLDLVYEKFATKFEVFAI